MYYPFLRARQFELITLRDLANEGALNEFIKPILEPVKETFNNLNLASKVFQKKQVKVYLIVNPIVGELAGDDLYILNYLRENEIYSFIPAFYYHNNEAFIQQSIDDYGLTDCMLICPSNIYEDNEELRNLVQQPQITSLNVEDPGRNRSLHRFFSGLDKTYIRLDDLFEKQPRNSEFLGIPEHKFSEEHKYYIEEGFQGFSDFTVIPSEFSDGGSTPRAVVIHFTYLKETNDIWIKHFTSETNDSISNVQGKFSEAASKAVQFCRENQLSNSAIVELEDYFDNQHYPGLGTVKKIAIKNYILVLYQYLSNR